MEVSQKVGWWNIKTKIYQIIKSLIILFIKLQFSNQVQQVFKSLCISISDLDFNLSLNPNGLVNVSSLIHLYYLRYTFFMILDLAYISKGLYVSNQVRSRSTYLLGLRATSLDTRRPLSS